MNNNTQRKHWKLNTDEHGVAWARMDREASAVNTLSAEALEELGAVLDEVRASSATGLVIASAKKSGFIAGADVKEFTRIKDRSEALAVIKRGQGVMNKIEKLGLPTVAMIHGFCLGGGLELALACRYRVASNEPGTKLGLPEVNLGIHPGFGGAARLPRLIGAPEAMKMMISGRAMDARKAAKIGLVDYAVPRRSLERAAVAMVTGKRAPKKLSFLAKASNHSIVRPLLAMQLRKTVAKKANKKHYPAPYALIELWKNHFDGLENMLAHEAESVADLITSPTAQNLVRVFFLQEQLKSAGDGVEFKPQWAHVVGAGAMGGDIAGWLACSGFKVSLQDTDKAMIAASMKRAGALFRKKLKKPRLVQAAMDRLMPDTQGRGVARADVIIEAIYENVEAKQALYAQMEPKMKPTAILATNTSSIPLETLGEKLANPGRLVGLHFFNPVSKMQLVEVVRGARTDDEVVKKAAAFVKAFNHLPVVVKSSPGFLVNRVLMPYLLEAVQLASEGIPISQIDKTATRFGMPMGPILLADTVGLDICLSVAGILSEQMKVKPPARLKELVDAGRLGRKTGAGFYDFTGGKQTIPPVPADYTPPVDIEDRLILRLLNECAACLRESVVENADLLDAGVIFGTGFAPFRGGPARHIITRGKKTVLDRLEEFERKYGDRFAPDEYWKLEQTEFNKRQE